MSKILGRPTKNVEVRTKLLMQARMLFAQKGFSKVTTRMIAREADSDPAMIRYYFGNKENLFRSVISETIKPLLTRIRSDNTSNQTISPHSFISMYYSLLSEAPELPKLIFRSIHDPDAVEHAIVNDIFKELMAHKATQLKDGIASNKEISTSFDATLILITTISLSVFPFLLPDDLKQELGIEVDKSFLNALAEHHQRLLKLGIHNHSNYSDN